MNTISAPSACLFADDGAPSLPTPSALVGAAFLVYVFDEYVGLEELARLYARLDAMATRVPASEQLVLLRVLQEMGRPPIGIDRPVRRHQLISHLRGAIADEERASAQRKRPVDSTWEALLQNICAYDLVVSDVGSPLASVRIDGFDLASVWNEARRGALSFPPARLGGFADDAASTATLKLVCAYPRGPQALLLAAARITGHHCAVDMYRRDRRLVPVGGHEELDGAIDPGAAAERERGAAFYLESAKYIALVSRTTEARRLCIFAQLLDIDNVVLSRWTGKSIANLNSDRRYARQHLRELAERELASMPADPRRAMELLDETALALADLAIQASATPVGLGSGDDDSVDSSRRGPGEDHFVMEADRQPEDVDLRAEILRRAADAGPIPESLFDAAFARLLGNDAVHELAHLALGRFRAARERDARNREEHVRALEARLRSGASEEASLRMDVVTAACAHGGSLPDELLEQVAAGASSAGVGAGVLACAPARLRAAVEANEERGRLAATRVLERLRSEKGG